MERGKLSRNYFEEYSAFEEKSLPLFIIEKRSRGTRMEMVHARWGSQSNAVPPLSTSTYLRNYLFNLPNQKPPWLGICSTPLAMRIEQFRMHQRGCFCASGLPKGRVPDAKFSRHLAKVVMRSDYSMSTMKTGCFSLALNPPTSEWSSLTVPGWHGPEKRSGTAFSKQPPRRGMTEPGTILAR